MVADEWILYLVLWAAWLRRSHPGFITVPILLVDCVSVAVAFIPGVLSASPTTFSPSNSHHIFRGITCLCYALPHRHVRIHLYPSTNLLTEANNSAGAMRKSNILCKSLSTVESLGAVSVIASDKTGTLTQNRMTAVNLAFDSDIRYSVDEARKLVETGGGGDACVKVLAAVSGICNDAEFDTSEADAPNGEAKVNGDATGKQ